MPCKIKHLNYAINSLMYIQLAATDTCIYFAPLDTLHSSSATITSMASAQGNVCNSAHLHDAVKATIDSDQLIGL